MTGTCPNCGNPVRPGARFCGSCGASLESGTSTTFVQPAGSTCPHCGKPVRTDAKFCPSCGEELSSQTTQRETRAISPGETQGQPAKKPGEKPSLIGTPTDIDTSSSPPQSNWPQFAVIIILSVIVLALASYLAWDTGLLSTNATATITPTQTMTVLPSATASVTIALETPTPTISPQPSSEPSATAQLTETTPTTVVIDEDFGNTLETNWTVWGTPEPQIRSALGYYLELEADSRAAGITSNVVFPFSENTLIRFDASLSAADVDLLSLDFDPQDVNRQPNSAPGAVHLDLGNDRLRLIVSDAPLCIKPLPDREYYTFTLKIEESGLSLWVDNDQLCPTTAFNLTLDQVRLSFSGRGRLDNILVTQQ